MGAADRIAEHTRGSAHSEFLQAFARDSSKPRRGGSFGERFRPRRGGIVEGSLYDDVPRRAKLARLLGVAPFAKQRQAHREACAESSGPERKIDEAVDEKRR